MDFQSFKKEDGSYKDPKGYVFYFAGNVYRYVEQSDFFFFSELLNSELYKELLNKKMIVNTKVIDLDKNLQLREHFPDSVNQVFQHAQLILPQMMNQKYWH